MLRLLGSIEKWISVHDQILLQSACTARTLYFEYFVVYEQGLGHGIPRNYMQYSTLPAMTRILYEGWQVNQ